MLSSIDHATFRVNFFSPSVWTISDTRKVAFVYITFPSILIISDTRKVLSDPKFWLSSETGNREVWLLLLIRWQVVSFYGGFIQVCGRFWGKNIAVNIYRLYVTWLVPFSPQYFVNNSEMVEFIFLRGIYREEVEECKGRKYRILGSVSVSGQLPTNPSPNSTKVNW